MQNKRKIKKHSKAKSKKSNNFNRQKITNFLLSFLAISLMAVIASYFFLPQEKTLQIKDIKKESKIQKDYQTYNKKQLIKQKIEKSFEKPKEDFFEEYTKELEKEYTNVEEIKKEIIEIIEDTKKTEIKIIDKIDEITKIVLEPKEKKEVIKEKDIIIDKRPKLAIIIDDVTLSSQVNNIQKIGHNISMSFMPPIKRHKNSAKIAQDLDFHMVHFPLQANSFKFEETHTLHIGDSYEKIEKRVKQVRAWYPNAKYTNNHTGSKFTADDQSMDYFFKALKKYNFIFLDSRTTSKTVALKYAKKHKVPFLARNIFLDNKLEYKYILNQLKKAIKIAKKSGYSVAIGHPHKITLKVLEEAKPLFKDLNLVYVNKIPSI